MADGGGQGEGVGVVGVKEWGGGGLGVVEVEAPTPITSHHYPHLRSLPLDPTTLDGLLLIQKK